MARLARRDGVRDLRPYILTAALAALLACAALSAPGARAQTQEEAGPGGAPHVPGELLVAYEDEGSEGVVGELAQDLGGEVEERLPLADAQLVEFPEIKERRSEATRERLLEKKKERLAKSPGVAAVDYNYLRSYSFVPDDPRFREQWHLRKVDAPAAWDRTRGRGAKIAIIDSGVAARHPDLRGKILAQRDFVDDDGTADDEVGHGTRVAGIVAAATDNGRGVAGACPSCRLLVAKVGDRTTLADAEIVEGIDWAVRRGADAMNLSFGGPERSAVLKRAVDRAWSAGVVVVAAAGNAGDTRAQYPAAYRRVISVSATDRRDRRAPFASYGRTIDVAAPGVGILSTRKPRSYGAQSGTSFSTPQVTALAGLLAAQGREAPAIRRRIEATARDLGPRGRDRFYGHGRVDFGAAVGRNTGARRKEEADRPKRPSLPDLPFIGAREWPFEGSLNVFPFTSAG